MNTEISASKSIFHSFHAVLCSMNHTHKNDIPMHLGQVLKWQKILVSNIFYNFSFAILLGNWASKMSEKFRLYRKNGFQNTFYTKCINAIIESIGPSIILRSIDSIGNEKKSVLDSILQVEIGAFVTVYIYQYISWVLLKSTSILFQNRRYQESAKILWASAWDFQQCGMFHQQSLRSACAYAQSDQSLC